MDRKEYEAVAEVANKYDFSVFPKPDQNEAIKYFDILSDSGEIPVSVIMNAVSSVIPTARLADAQSRRLSCEDTAV